MEIRLEIADWREQIADLIADDCDDCECDQYAEKFRNAVLYDYQAAGHDYEEAYTQKVGSHVLIQSASDTERQILEDAIDRHRQAFGELTTIENLIPADAQYTFDAATGLATVQIETKHRAGQCVPVYAEITAKVEAKDYDGEMMIEADYVSHEGEATQDDIDYALRVIETNDFGV